MEKFSYFGISHTIKRTTDFCWEKGKNFLQDVCGACIIIIVTWAIKLPRETYDRCRRIGRRCTPFICMELGLTSKKRWFKIQHRNQGCTHKISHFTMSIKVLLVFSLLAVPVSSQDPVATRIEPVDGALQVFIDYMFHPLEFYILPKMDKHSKFALEHFLPVTKLFLRGCLKAGFNMINFEIPQKIKEFLATPLGVLNMAVGIVPEIKMSNSTDFTWRNMVENIVLVIEYMMRKEKEKKQLDKRSILLQPENHVEFNPFRKR